MSKEKSVKGYLLLSAVFMVLAYITKLSYEGLTKFYKEDELVTFLTWQKIVEFFTGNSHFVNHPHEVHIGVFAMVFLLSFIALCFLAIEAMMDAVWLPIEQKYFHEFKKGDKDA